MRLLDEQSGERPSSFRATPSTSSQQTGVGFDGLSDRKAIPYTDTGGASRFFYCAKASRRERGAGNDHPTVKPLALMRWLVRLVTSPGGTVLDPFLGSGTTAHACELEGFECVGIEQDERYAERARQRVAHAAGPLFAEVVG